jgi:hypothetical protein
VTKYFDKFRDMEKDVLSWEEKKMEVDLIKIINCYEKTYGRYFTDSVNEWRELDRLNK